MPDPFDYSDLRALYINCTLTKSPATSHTQTLIDRSRAVMHSAGVTTDSIRAVDHDIPPGVYPDMTEKGWEADEWPTLFRKVQAADILVLGTPIWLGEKSSVCTKIVERLYAHSADVNDQGQYDFYGRVGGCLVTGNEDGVKHCAMNLLFSLQHLGFTVPPQADAGWIGEAGPGPSYGDEQEDGGYVGLDNDFTNRNTAFMAWNLMHVARMLKDRGGIPVHGNSSERWEAGEKFEFPNPAAG